MIEFLRLILHIMASLFKPRTKLVAEILILRQQLNVLRRQVSKRPRQIRPRSGFRARSSRRFPGTVHLVILFGTETLRTAWSSGSGCVRWAFGTSRLLLDRRGRTRTSRD